MVTIFPLGGLLAGSRRRARRADVNLLRAQAECPCLAEHCPGRLTGEQIGGAYESGDELGGRLFVDLSGGGDLLDAAGIEDGHPVRHRERLFLIVGHEDERDPHVALDGFEFHLHLLAQFEVQGAEGLVKQQHPRSVHQCAGQGHSLPLPARQLLGPAVGILGKSHLGQGLGRPFLTLLLRHLLDAQAVLDVLHDTHVRKEGVVLEDRVDITVEGRNRGDVHSAERDGSGGGQFETRDHPQHGGLA